MGKKAPAMPSREATLVSSVVAIVAFVTVFVGSWRNPRPEEAEPDVPEQAARRPPAVLAAVDRWQRRRRWAGFSIGVARKFGDDRAGYLAALVSYFAFFSVFPLMLALTSILGMVLDGNPTLRDKITGTAAEQIPLIGPSLRVGELGGSTSAVVLGIAVALWSGLKVIDAAQNALNEVWDVPRMQRPNVVKRRAKSVLLLGLIGLSLLGSVVISTVAGMVLHLPGVSTLAIYVMTVLLNFGVFLVAFKLLSDVDHTWAELLPGSAFAAVGWFLVQVPGAYYIQRVITRSSGTYQSFATVIGLLTFFFLASQVVILGAEINVVRARRLWPRSLLANYGELTPADEQACAASAMATTRLPSQRIVVGFGPHRRLR